MNLIVKRHTFTDQSTIGDLLINGGYFCHTLEPTMREIKGEPVEEWKIPGKTAIPVGDYKVIIDYSPHFQRDLPHVLTVPGFDEVRIHTGNFPKETEACLLVGYGEGVNEITESVKALADLLVKMKAAIKNKESISIYYINIGLKITNNFNGEF